MNASTSSLNVKRLILVPALIALAVTMLRLLGELGQGPSFLFNREAGAWRSCSTRYLELSTQPGYCGARTGCAASY